jgi:multicomponent K+:H+ antiporter subunit D
MAAIIGFGRAGIQRFWAMPGQRVPRVRLIEMLPVLALLALCAVLTVAVAVPAEYLDATARELHAPRDLVDAVLPP